MSFGSYPEVGVADARLRMADTRNMLLAGDERGLPAAGQPKAQRDAESSEELAELYPENWARSRKRIHREDEYVRRRDVIPARRGRRARSIERKDVLALLDGIVQHGSPIAANRTLAAVRKMYNSALSRDLVPANPCAMVAAPAQENARERVPGANEIRAFWFGLPATGIGSAIELALKLMLVTAQRKGGVSRAEWPEFDLDSKRWTIPAEKAKSGRAHRVPLSGLAMEILEQARVRIADARWIFRSPRGASPVHATTISHAVQQARGRLGLPDVTRHDLRRTGASHMTGLGVSCLVVSKVLNHAESGVTAVYDRHGYDREKRRALEQWASDLLALIGGERDG